MRLRGRASVRRVLVGTGLCVVCSSRSIPDMASYRRGVGLAKAREWKECVGERRKMREREDRRGERWHRREERELTQRGSV
eukprot:2471906-Rhodomonas_salina.1